MYIGAVAQRKEAEKTIFGWPIHARQLFAILLAKVELPEEMRIVLNLDIRYKQYMLRTNATTQPSAPENPIELEKILGVSLRMEKSATGQDISVARAQEQEHIKRHTLETLLDGLEQNCEPNQIQLPPQEQLLRRQHISLTELLLPVNVSVLNTRPLVQRVKLPFTVGTLCNSLRCILSGEISSPDLDMDHQDMLSAVATKRLQAILPLGYTDETLHEMPMILRIGSSIEFYLTKDIAQRLMQWKNYNSYHQLHSITWQELLGFVEENIELEMEGIATAELQENGRITFFFQEPLLGMIVQFERSIFRYVAHQY